MYRPKENKHDLAVQKGPINIDAQYNAGSEREPEMTMCDINNMAMRRDGMTMTKHEPKR